LEYEVVATINPELLVNETVEFVNTLKVDDKTTTVTGTLTPPDVDPEKEITDQTSTTVTYSLKAKNTGTISKVVKVFDDLSLIKVGNVGVFSSWTITAKSVPSRSNAGTIPASTSLINITDAVVGAGSTLEYEVVATINPELLVNESVEFVNTLKVDDKTTTVTGTLTPPNVNPEKEITSQTSTTVTYSLKAINTGTTAKVVTVFDDLSLMKVGDVGVFSSWIITAKAVPLGSNAGTIPASTSLIEITDAVVGAGSTLEYEVVATINPALLVNATVEFVNTLKVDDKTTTVTGTLTPPDVNPEKEITDQTSTTVTYSLKAINTGTTAKVVTVFDDLSLIKIGDVGVFSSWTITAKSVPPGSNAGTIPAATTLINITDAVVGAGSTLEYEVVATINSALILEKSEQFTNVLIVDEKSSEVTATLEAKPLLLRNDIFTESNVQSFNPVSLPSVEAKNANPPVVRAGDDVFYFITLTNVNPFTIKIPNAKKAITSDYVTLKDNLGNEAFTAFDFEG
ncbi:MAG: hypothetical protein ACRC5T_04410, partial [Cetobacterium sp.]